MGGQGSRALKRSGKGKEGKEGETGAGSWFRSSWFPWGAKKEPNSSQAPNSGLMVWMVSIEFQGPELNNLARG